MKTEIEAMIDLKIDIARKIFLLKSKSISKKDRKQLQEEILDTVISNDMSQVYEYTSKILELPVDNYQLGSMRQNNTNKLDEHCAKIKQAEENQGGVEICEALLARVEYMALIGDMKDALAYFKVVEDKTVPLGPKMHTLFSIARLAMFYEDWPLVEQTICAAKKQLEGKTDWEMKNRLQVYEAVLMLMTCKFESAGKLLLDSVATFNASELMTYEQCIFIVWYPT